MVLLSIKILIKNAISRDAKQARLIHGNGYERFV